MKTINTQSGISLIEVLATVIVIAVGLLGASSMQLLSLKGSSSSHYRVQATVMVNALAERMRFNQDGVKDGEYLVTADTPISCHDLPDSYVNCSKDSCNAEQLALFDLQQTKCGLATIEGIKRGGIANVLPEGDVVVSCGDEVCTENIEHTITVSWLARKNDTTDNEKETVSLAFIP